MTHEKHGWADYGRITHRGAISWYPMVATYALEHLVQTQRV